MLEKIKETVKFLEERISTKPEAGIILGTGLGGMVNEIKADHIFDYEDIPNFPVSTVEGHHGRLIFGEVGGKQIVAMQGRFHFYEGYDMQEVTFPVRVMKLLGIKHLYLSNASGGMHPDFEIGDLMILNDHINLLPNPLIGKNIDELGPRFPDMSEPYCKKTIELAKEIAKENNINVQEGCYVATSGPTFETPKEYEYFRVIGGDTVGMSTVPEVIVARHMNIPVFGLSIITDLGVPGKIVDISHEEVQEVAIKAEPKMTLLVKELISRL